MEGNTAGFIGAMLVISALLGIVVAIDAKAQRFISAWVGIWGIGSFLLPAFVVPAYILYRILSKIDKESEGLARTTVVIYLILSSATMYLIYYNVFKK